jgi:hypothetical protein
VVSAVICKRHPGGAQPGILACSHVSTDTASVLGNSPAPIVVDDADLQTRLVVLACPACCGSFSLSENEPVSADIFFDESRFPYVAPICSLCAIDVGLVSAVNKDAV